MQRRSLECGLRCTPGSGSSLSRYRTSGGLDGWAATRKIIFVNVKDALVKHIIPHFTRSGS
jgi:hypothetical protein